MEFPDLGKHCTEPTCKQLDYLPLKCDACESIFCREHISYNNHNCPSLYKKDVQVPVCPLCNTPIPGKRGEQPDIAVGAHIDNDCQSDPAKNRRKIFTNKCSVKGCKVKEIVRITCGDCKLNFCLKHRHPTDHQCEGAAGAARRRAAEAAMARHARLKGTGAPSSSNQAPRTNFGAAMMQSIMRSRDTVTGIQGSLEDKSTEVCYEFTNFQKGRISLHLLRTCISSQSEDEALARALAISMQETSQQNDHSSSAEEQVDSDRMLARAIAESERLQRAGGVSPSSQNKCCIS